MTLAELVSARRHELGLSLRQAAERSGGLISHGHLGGIESDAVQRTPSDRVLRGISAALDIPITELRRAAGVPPRQTPFTLPDRARQLSAKERRLVLQLVDALLDARKRG